MWYQRFVYKLYLKFQTLRKSSLGIIDLPYALERIKKRKVMEFHKEELLKFLDYKDKSVTGRYDFH